MDPFTVIDRLKELVASEPWRVRHILRVLPVEFVVPSEIESIRMAVKELACKIGKDSFRITVEKRHCSFQTLEIITAIADVIENKVDLENPVWTVLVEVVGSRTGVSVIRQGELFSAVIEKRK